MNNKLLKLAIKNVAAEPPTGPISGGDYGAGLINPEGTPYPISGGSHNGWILENREWLKQRYGFEISDEEAEKASTGVSDIHYLIRRLVEEKGWLKVRGGSIISRNPRSDRSKVVEAIQWKYLPKRDHYEIYTPEYREEIRVDFKDIERELAQAKAKYRIKISSRDTRV